MSLPPRIWKAQILSLVFHWPSLKCIPKPFYESLNLFPTHLVLFTLSSRNYFSQSCYCQSCIFSHRSVRMNRLQHSVSVVLSLNETSGSSHCLQPTATWLLFRCSEIFFHRSHYLKVHDASYSLDFVRLSHLSPYNWWNSTLLYQFQRSSRYVVSH
jgi:hypothetical protein